MEQDIHVDAKGLCCPMPIFHAKKALDQMASGQVLRIDITEPGGVKDFVTMCSSQGHEFLGYEEDMGVFSVRMRKG